MEIVWKDIWKIVLDQCRKMMQDDQDLVLYSDAEMIFRDNYRYYHNMFVENFMKPGIDELDRHKNAAVIICAIIKSDILGIAAGKRTRQIIDDAAFIANEKIALNVALSYMYEELIYEFKEGEIPYKNVFSDYVFPRPLSCGRDYTEVICRDLYYAKRYFELNPVTIANFLFLLEMYSFAFNKIDIDSDKWKKINQKREDEHLQKRLESVQHMLNIFDLQMEEKRKKLKDEEENLLKALQDI